MQTCVYVGILFWSIVNEINLKMCFCARSARETLVNCVIYSYKTLVQNRIE